jgi:hypothetical protein
MASPSTSSGTVGPPSTVPEPSTEPTQSDAAITEYADSARRGCLQRGRGPLRHLWRGGKSVHSRTQLETAGMAKIWIPWAGRPDLIREVCSTTVFNPISVLFCPFSPPVQVTWGEVTMVCNYLLVMMLLRLFGTGALFPLRGLFSPSTTTVALGVRCFSHLPFGSAI